jgi:hypothetical protein
VYLPIFPSTGVPIEAANTSTTNVPKQGTKPVVLASKSFHLLQRLTTTPGLFGPVRAVAADFFGLGHDLLFLDSIKSAIMDASRTLSPCGTAQTLPLRFADSSPQASCGPSPPKTLLGTWEFTAPHVRSGSMSRFTRDQNQ